MDYISISWTRPVPWIAFTNVSPDIDQAARQSRTIRYQRDLIRRWVAEQGGQLIRELVFIELAPDRATEEAVEDIAAIIRTAPPDVAFVHVDFRELYGRRHHPPLLRLLHEREAIALPPTPILIDRDPPQTGRMRFDPLRHFRRWDQAEREHAAAKADHAHLIMTALAALRNLSWTKRAAALNESGHRTHGGKPWTADNLRKFCQKQG